MSRALETGQVRIIAISKCQAYCRRYLARNQVAWIKSVSGIRYKIAKEIYTSEVIYLENLNTLVEKFAKPLQQDAEDSAKMITKSEARQLFSQFPVFIGFSKKLQALLKPRIESWSQNTSIGDVFVQIAFFFKGYSQYFNNYKGCLETISRLRATNSKFANFLKEHEAVGDRIVPLEQYMITPVQRITRYELLLRNMVENTWKTHQDYGKLVQALDYIGKANDQVNEMKRLRENYDRLIEIHNQLRVGKKCNWDKHILMTYNNRRRLLREGDLLQHLTRNQSVRFFCILFEDLMLWTKPKKSMLVLKYCIYFKNLKLNLRSEYSQHRDYIYMIHLKTESEHLVVRGETDAETLGWYGDLKICLNQMPHAHISDDALRVQDFAANAKKEDSSTPTTSKLENDSSAPKDYRSPCMMLTRLNLTELRYLENYRKSRQFQIQLESKHIREWQVEPNSDELAEYRVPESEISRFSDVYPESVYSAYRHLRELLAQLDLRCEVPHLLLLGRVGEGKTYLLNMLLDISLPLENLKRPLCIRIINTEKYADEPLLTVCKDLSLDPPVLSDTVVSKSELKNEILCRATNSYCEIPIYLRYERAGVLDLVVVDTPGLDSYQFHAVDMDALQNGKSFSSPTVRGLVYRLARQTHFQLLFVEECKSRSLMNAIGDLTSIFDPAFNRSFLVYSKFYHKLREFHSPTELNSYFDFLVSSVPTFFVTLPSPTSVSANGDDLRQLIARTYACDLEALQHLQCDTQYANCIGFYNLRRFLTVWLKNFSLQHLPKALAKMVDMESSILDKIDDLQKLKGHLNIPELRSLSIMLAQDFAHLLPNIWINASHINTQLYGQTLEDEESQLIGNAYHNWLVNEKDPIFLSDEVLNTIAYNNCRLYGLPQFHRLISVFHVVVGQLDVDYIDIRRIHLFIDQNCYSQINCHFEVLCDIAHKRARHAISTLLGPLCKRAVNILHQLGFIAHELINDKKIDGYKYLNFPTFINHVHVIYNRETSLLCAQCQSICQTTLTQHIKLDYLDYQDYFVLADTAIEDVMHANLKLISKLFDDVCERLFEEVSSTWYQVLNFEALQLLCQNVLNHVFELTDMQLKEHFYLDPSLEHLAAKQQTLQRSLDKIRKLRSEFSSQYENFRSESETRLVPSPLLYQVCPENPQPVLQEHAN